MTPQMAILVFPAFLVLAGLIRHSLRFRGRKETLWFFLACALFGIARGNVIWWITTVHFQGKFPYIFQHQVLGVYHDSFTADAGWIICTYLGAYLAQRVSDRIPWARGRVFPFISLACVFNVCLAYAVESTAITMGWWSWTISTKSMIFRDVPLAGIWAWCSIAIDFLLPYVLLRHVRRPGQWWPYLSLLIFPLHMLTHLSNDRVSDLLPVVPYDIYYWIMLLVILILPFASTLRMERPLFPSRAMTRTVGEEGKAKDPAFLRYLPFLGLGVVVTVLLVCDLAIHRDPALLTGKVPLAFFTLLAVPAVPAIAVLGLAGALAVLGGAYFIAPLGVPGFLYALKGRDLWPRFRILRWAYFLVPVLATVWFYAWSRDRSALDHRYWSLIGDGKTLVETRPDSAAARFQQAIDLKPYSLPAREELIILSLKLKAFDRAEALLEEMLELRPISEDVHANFGNLYLMRGDYDQAEIWFRKALALNPKHPYSRQMIANLDRLRRGEPWQEDLSRP